VTPAEFRKIRERLGLTQKELSEVLGLAGYNPVGRYELGERTPSLLTQAVMSILGSQSEKDASDFIVLLKKHLKKVSNAKA
jgi:transcriptional regulator with XRE-family HTH domain